MSNSCICITFVYTFLPKTFSMCMTYSVYNIYIYIYNTTYNIHVQYLSMYMEKNFSCGFV